MKMFTEIAHIVRRVETTYPPIVFYRGSWLEVTSWWTLSGCREPRERFPFYTSCKKKPAARLGLGDAREHATLKTARKARAA